MSRDKREKEKEEKEEEKDSHKTSFSIAHFTEDKSRTLDNPTTFNCIPDDIQK
jgi:hypothetical protein